MTEIDRRWRVREVTHLTNKGDSSHTVLVTFTNGKVYFAEFHRKDDGGDLKFGERVY